MKLGISIKLDVTKIDKSRIFEGQKGKYLDLTSFIDLDNLDQYDNNGFISQSVTKDEREQGVKTPILGNVKVFYKGESGSQQPTQSQSSPTSGSNQGQAVHNPSLQDLEDIPFNRYEFKSVV